MIHADIVAFAYAPTVIEDLPEEVLPLPVPRTKATLHTPGGAEIKVILTGPERSVQAQLPNGRIMQWDEDLLAELYHYGRALQDAALIAGYKP